MNRFCAPDTDAAGAGELLSVIVPVYDVAPYLHKCVRSILAQTYPAVEAVLVDDGSTDDSGAICDALAAEDGRVRVIHQPNGGLSAARNAGLDAARGAWIGFVDGDDAIEPEMYAVLIGACRRQEADIAACAFNYIFPAYEQPLGTSGRETVYEHAAALETLPLEKDLRFEACAKVYRRACIGEIRFRPGQVYEDIRFSCLTLLAAKRAVYVDSAMYRYLQNRPGSTNTRFPPEKLRTVAECDGFADALEREGLVLAAQRMRAFTLDFIIRMSVNARACGASRELRHELTRMYRARLRASRGNPEIRRIRAALFALSPALYDAISRILHKRASS